MLEILLHASLEALDATAGRLQLDYDPAPVQLATGPETWLEVLERDFPTPDRADGPTQLGHTGRWTLTLPMRVVGSPRAIIGSLSLARADRSFEDVEIALVSELISKAELSRRRSSHTRSSASRR